MSGIEVLKELQKINKDIDVIISSGHSEDSTLMKNFENAKASVSKPYKIKDLLQTVRAVLDS